MNGMEEQPIIILVMVKAKVNLLINNTNNILPRGYTFPEAKVTSSMRNNNFSNYYKPIFLYIITGFDVHTNTSGY